MVCLPSMQEALGSIASTPGVVAHVTVKSQSWEGGEDRMIRGSRSFSETIRGSRSFSDTQKV